MFMRRRKHREFLCTVREAEASGKRLDMFVRRGKQRTFLHTVWEAEAGGRAALPL